MLGAGLLVIGAALGLALIVHLSSGAETPVLQGLVASESGPVAGAVVRLQTGSSFTVTDGRGRFKLSIPKPDKDEIVVTAWAPGYYVGWTESAPGAENLQIALKPYYTTDNPDYNWFSHEGAQGSLSCSHCLPCYTEWKADAHSQSAVNPRFLSLYNGTTLTGKPGVPTLYHFDSTLGVNVPVAPSLGQNAVGPGFRLDYPELGGNCAACHVPGAAARPGGAYHVDIREVSGIDLEGVFCEFCHKVGDVRLDPSTGLPDPSKPGVLSMRLYRPDEGQQLFFGNFDDVSRRVTYLPLIKESAFCATCHFGAFWGTVAYNSFGEWLDSPYSDPETGRTCQSCHMPPVDYDYFILPEQGGLHRDPERIVSHLMPGAVDSALLQATAHVAIEAGQEGNRLRVTVRVTNTGAGHHIPTDTPLRNVILLVSATDAGSQPLTLVDGPVIPEWGGVGDPAQGYYAGLPGVLYAKILADFYTGETPTYAYWRQTRLVSDNRIPALATDESTYQFELPATDGPITVEARLFLRRAFIELMDLKNWNTPDILMAHQTVTVAQ
jgi:hypothetical protein